MHKTPVLWLFDFDGVLVDTSSLTRECYFPTSFDRFRETSGLTTTNAELEAIIRENRAIHTCEATILCKYWNVPTDWIEDLYAYVPIHHAHDIQRLVAPNPQLAGLLGRLHQRGDTLAILTQAHTLHVEACGRAAGILDVFSKTNIFDRRETPGFSKHTPHPYQNALAKLSPPKGQRCIMVEDNAANLPAAMASGIEAALVGPTHATGAPAQHRFATVCDLLETYLDAGLPQP